MSMKKVWIVAVFALAAVSCVRMEDISCDGVESVEVRSLGASRSLVEVSLRASNASGAAGFDRPGRSDARSGRNYPAEGFGRRESPVAPSVGGSDGPHSGGNTF